MTDPGRQIVYFEVIGGRTPGYKKATSHTLLALKKIGKESIIKLDEEYVEEKLHKEKQDLSEVPPYSMQDLFLDFPELDKKANDCNYIEDLKSMFKSLYLNQDGEEYCQIWVTDHIENWPLNCSYVKNHIVRSYMDLRSRILSDQRIKQGINYLSSFLHKEKIKHATHLRCAFNDECAYIDLCRDDWKVIKITGNETIICSPPEEIRFIRRNHMQELKVDLQASIKDIHLIFKYARITESSQILFLPYFVGLPFAGIPWPIARAMGPKGASKTESQKFIRACIDPSQTLAMPLDNDTKELILKFTNHYYPVFDNVRSISDHQSDLLCQVVSGTGIDKRKLFTDNDSIITFIKRKLAINGIAISSGQPDLLDRLLTFWLERVPNDERKDLDTLWTQFHKDQPKITGAICKILQDVLAAKTYLTIGFNEVPRMADFSKFGEAISRSIGYSEDEFMRRYWEEVKDTNQEAINDHSFGTALQSIIFDDITKFKKLEKVKVNGHTLEWEIAAADLLEKCKTRAEELKIDCKDKTFPKAANKINQVLGHIKADLREVGISYERGQKTKSSRNFKFIVSIVLSSPHDEKTGDDKGDYTIDDNITGDDKDDKVTIKTKYSHRSALDENNDQGDDKDDTLSISNKLKEFFADGKSKTQDQITAHFGAKNTSYFLTKGMIGLPNINGECELRLK